MTTVAVLHMIYCVAFTLICIYPKRSKVMYDIYIYMSYVTLLIRSCHHDDINFTSLSSYLAFNLAPVLHFPFAFG